MAGVKRVCKVVGKPGQYTAVISGRVAGRHLDEGLSRTHVDGDTASVPGEEMRGGAIQEEGIMDAEIQRPERPCCAQLGDAR